MFEYGFSLVTFEYFLLVLVRIASFVMVAPFFSFPNVPNRVKIGFSLFVAILVMAVIGPEEGASYESVIGYAVMVIREVMVGLMIGYCGNICNYIIIFAGNIMDMDMGLSMAQEFNSAMGTEVTITGNLYYYAVSLLLITSGMYQYIIRAVIDSFQLIPLGAAVFQWDSLFTTMVTFATDLFVISFRICLPVFGCIMILNCILGVMSKVAPQMNMFSVGIQIKILVGFGVLFLTLFLLPDIANFIFKEMRNMILSVVKGMY